MKPNRAAKPREALDPAEVELARLIAWVAVQDYLEELKSCPQNGQISAANEHPSELVGRGEST